MDLAVIETGNGGDLQLVGNDLALVYAGENNPYLGMFGGNIEAVTKTKVQEELSYDWWGNTLLMPNNQSIQFNSLTERILNSTPLTSSGRIQIENTIKKDLAFMGDFADIFVSVSIVATDRIQVTIRITLSDSSVKVKVINFRKKLDGDFFISDFNDDFFI